MYFSSLFSKPIVRNIFLGQGAAIAGELVKSLYLSKEEKKINTDSVSYESSSSENLHMIFKQAFADSGFKGPIHIQFNKNANVAVSQYYSFNSQSKAAMVYITPEFIKDFKSQETYAIAGHEAAHAVHYHEVFYKAFAAASVLHLDHLIDQKTQDLLPVMNKSLYAFKFPLQALPKTLPVGIGLLSAYGTNKYIMPQVQKLMEIDADLTSARLLGTKEESISVMNKLLKEKELTTVHEMITSTHPSPQTRLQLINLIKAKPNESTPRYSFFQPTDSKYSEEQLVHKASDNYAI